jgi:hypothetical protein
MNSPDLFPHAIIITIPRRGHHARATREAMLGAGYPASRISIMVGCDEKCIDDAYKTVSRLRFTGEPVPRQPGNLGATLSHIYALRAAAWARFPGVLIIEDDTTFDENFTFEARRCATDSDHVRWLGWIRYADRDGTQEAWMKHEHLIADGQLFSGVHCYHVPGRHLFALAALFETIRMSPDDVLMLSHWQGIIPGIAIMPQVAHQPDRALSKVEILQTKTEEKS